MATKIRSHITQKSRFGLSGNAQDTKTITIAVFTGEIQPLLDAPVEWHSLHRVLGRGPELLRECSEIRGISNGLDRFFRDGRPIACLT